MGGTLFNFAELFGARGGRRVQYVLYSTCFGEVVINHTRPVRDVGHIARDGRHAEEGG